MDQLTFEKPVWTTPLPPTPPPKPFADKEQADQSRLGWTWKYYAVVFAAWCFYACYFVIRGYELASQVALGVIGSFAIHYFALRKRDCSIRSNAELITHSYLVISAIGLFLCSISHPQLTITLLFFTNGIIFTNMLFGVRGSLPWLLVASALFVAHPFVFYGVEEALQPHMLDDTMIRMGIMVVLFASLCQIESFHRRRASDLVALSQGLQEKTKELNQLATTDALTGLANRFQFTIELKKQLNRALAENEPLTLLLLDMDGFKQVNDTLGHAVGDEALIEIANRLRQPIQNDAFPARLGGDEFCVLLPNTTREESVQTATKLYELLCGEYRLNKVKCHLGTSIGIAACPHDATTPENLLAFADTAMFHAKENHRAFALYDTEQTAQILEYCSVRDRLSKALDNNEFFLTFQPQYDIHTNRIIGAEALIRWRHQGEVIPPDRFISHLESTRRIIEVTHWVLDRTCEQQRIWREDHGLEIRVAVNISTIDFHDPEFCDRVRKIVQAHGIDNAQIELEITESVLIENVELVADRLNRLKQMGFTISIDDFGTGYSSLAYLRNLPIDKLKIDREFVKGIPDEDDGTIASTMILLGKTLGMEVVAEGVETQAQADFLRAGGCDQFQGFLASRPIPPTALVELMNQENPNETASAFV